MLCALVCLAVTPARAGCSTVGNESVVLRLSSDLERGFRVRLLAELDAVLAERGIDVCSEPLAGESPTASITIEAHASDEVEVEVVSRREGSERQLQRLVALAEVPRDSRAFTVALVTDELLRAVSTALLEDLRLDDEPPSAAPALASAPLLDAPAADPEQSRSWRVGIRSAAEHFLGGQTHVGGDGLLQMTLGGNFALELALGLRQGLAVDTSNGRVTSHALTAGSNVRYALIDRPFAAGLGLGLHMAWVRLEGSALRSTIDDESLEGLACYGQATSFAAFELGGPWWFDVTAALGLPVRAVEATDSGRTATGVSGVQLALFGALTLEL